jgi:hypothetical protein
MNFGSMRRRSKSLRKEAAKRRLRRVAGLPAKAGGELAVSGAVCRFIAEILIVFGTGSDEMGHLISRFLVLRLRLLEPLAALIELAPR